MWLISLCNSILNHYFTLYRPLFMDEINFILSPNSPLFGFDLGLLDLLADVLPIEPSLPVEQTQIATYQPFCTIFFSLNGKNDLLRMKRMKSAETNYKKNIFVTSYLNTTVKKYCFRKQGKNAVVKTLNITLHINYINHLNFILP